VIYHVNYDPRFARSLRKLDRLAQKRILDFLINRIDGGSNPRLCGKPLKGKFKGLWRYRVGDYRIICQIIDNRLTVAAVEVGGRGNIYK
jgi:mRNA interferase RelE/StbE